MRNSGKPLILCIIPWKSLKFSWHKPWKIQKNTLENPWKPWNLSLKFGWQPWRRKLKEHHQKGYWKRKKKMDQDRILTYFGVNPFSTNVLFMDKPSSWFLLAKCLRNTCGRMTFSVKMQVINLYFYLKCLSSTGVFQTFC